MARSKTYISGSAERLCGIIRLRCCKSQIAQWRTCIWNAKVLRDGGPIERCMASHRAALCLYSGTDGDLLCNGKGRCTDDHAGDKADTLHDVDLGPYRSGNFSDLGTSTIEKPNRGIGD